MKQKYLIPKTLVEAFRCYPPISFTIIFKMTIDYIDDSFTPTDYGQDWIDLFAPIRAEIDAGNKKKKKGPVNLVYPYNTGDFMDAWQLLLKEPKWSNKTNTALQVSLNKIATFSKGNVADAIEIITNSIAGGYQGVFELKNKPTHAKQPTNANPIWRR